MPKSPVRITAAGLDLSLVPSGQVKFPASQNASADANTLDDYEEGTFTPALTFDTPGNLSVAYAAQIGRYTKVGRLVTCVLNIQLSTFTHSTATGGLRITGLPFTPANNSQCYYSGSMTFRGITKAGYSFIPYAMINATRLHVSACASGATFADVGAADMPSGGVVDLYITITYEV